MMAKLTLILKSKVLQKAEFYAKRSGRSLSELIENYLESLSNAEKSGEKLSPKLKKIVGAVKLPARFNEKRVLRKQLEAKQL